MLDIQWWLAGDENSDFNKCGKADVDLGIETIFVKAFGYVAEYKQQHMGLGWFTVHILYDVEVGFPIESRDRLVLVWGAKDGLSYHDHRLEIHICCEIMNFYRSINVFPASSAGPVLKCEKT